ncbi:nucleolar protein 14 [Hyaloraphidium curvatum]|nr:nucleolar protein 14 [Hyaloraphidium curvatum]
MEGKQAAGKGGSALKRLKRNLHDVGILGPKAKRRKTAPAEQAAKTIERKQKLSAVAGENPFELKFTRQKHDVLGRKSRGVQGRPGVSKVKGEEKRVKTLLPELKKGKRDSQFVDRRFGESNPTMSLEEKMMERFVREKQRSLRRGGDNLFNLEDNDDDGDAFGGLTHLGRSLEDAMDDTIGEEDSDLDDQIDEDTVGAAHFGGFAERDEPGNKSRNEIMKEIIAKSKFHKMERQKTKDENEDLRRELDAEVDDVRMLVKDMEEPAPKGGKVAGAGPNAQADYDVIVHQLAGEKRAKPQDRLKSEEELALERKEKLERLEQDRQRRLQGLLPEDEAATFGALRLDTSGDYLEPMSNFLGALPLQDSKPLTYRDGRLVNGEISMSRGNPARRSNGSDEDPESGDDSDDDENESAGSEASAEGNDSDLESDIVDDERGQDGMNAEIEEPEEERAQKAALREARRQAALKELPFVFPAPASYEQFASIVDGRSVADLDTVVTRLRSLYHVKLHPQNKSKMETLYLILVQHLANCYSPASHAPDGGDVVVRHIRELAQEMPEAAFRHAHDYLAELKERLEAGVVHGTRKGIINASDVAMLQLIGQLFPTSDLRHPITTPLQMLVCKFLGLKLQRSYEDVMRGLALCNMVLEFQKLSKRFMPEAASYLAALLAALVPELKSAGEKLSSVPSIKLGGKRPLWELAVPAVGVVGRMVQLYQDLPALPEIFAGHAKSIVDLIPLATGSARDTIQRHKEAIEEAISKAIADRKPLQLQQHKPIAIPSYLPKFEENFSADRRYDPNRERQQNKKLQVQYKKEFKGAMREVRKDTTFVHRQRLAEIKEKDAAYKKKMSRVMGVISQEAGEINKAERMGKKKRG